MAAPDKEHLVLKEEEKVDAKSDTGSPEKRTPIRKTAFVPNYEPIQTRKRTKTPHDTPVSPALSATLKKDTVRKPVRSRLTRDEVLTPVTGPKPKAVPKSLLILEPDLLPRTTKKKQVPLVSTVQIHASALINQSPSVAWPATNVSPVSVSVSGTPIMPSVVSSLVDGSLRKAKIVSGKLAGGVLDQRASFAGGESLDKKQEVKVSQNPDGTVSYILATMDGESSDNFITVTDGHISAVETSATEQDQVTDTTENAVQDRSDSHTPTSLLLLAEAAYPSSASSQPAAITTSVTQSPPKPLPSSSTDIQEENIAPKPTTPPAFMTISCQGGSSTIVDSAADDQTSSMDVDSAWTCTVCGEVMSESEREQHLSLHLDAEEDEEFMCETCGEQLKDEEDLELHMAVEHDDEEGEHDSMDFEDEEDENGEEEEGEDMENVEGACRPLTLLSTSATPMYSCEQCGESFTYAAYLRQHVKTTHANTGTVFTCTMCPRSFTSESALEMHSCLHQKPGAHFKCIRCSQSFASASLLSSHARTCVTVAIHTSAASSKRGVVGRRTQNRSRTSNHVCDVCRKTFTSEVYLKAHQLSHETDNSSHRNRGLQCLYCEDKFHHLGPLKEHMLAKHPKAFPFKCTICQRGFSRDSSRLAHEQTHQSLKLFFCSECGEGFTLQTYLNRHMKYRHLKPVKFPCKMCEKQFVRQADLIKHMRVHTGEKPFVCEQCGHGFTQQSNYRYHMMRHRGEKPHMCPMCNRGFRIPSHLKMHMQLHLNERFTCQYCQKVFSQSRYLSRHLRTHTKGHQIKPANQILPAPSVPISDQSESIVVYETSPNKTEQQVVVDTISGDVTEHVVVQAASGETESVIQFIVDDKHQEEETKTVSILDQDGNAIIATEITETDTGELRVTSADNSQTNMKEEQAYVNADEGTQVVVGAFSEGEGGSMEDGNVTLPFKDLTQLLGGKHYNCDVCSESFSIRPNSMYNMIHTGQSHILVINLNDHQHHDHADS